ncbi:MAG TPA: hypothetical protein VF520_00785 [Thermoleophilaceae bacterium]
MKRTTLAVLAAASFAALAAIPATASAAPAALTGTCSFDGDATFSKPVGLTPKQGLQWTFISAGNCTGVINGGEYVETPATLRFDASGPVGCTVGWSLNGRFSIELTEVTSGDTTLTGDFQLVQTVVNTLHLQGDGSGHALGRTTFIQQNGVPLLTGCIDGTTIYELKANHAFVAAALKG